MKKLLSGLFLLLPFLLIAQNESEPNLVVGEAEGAVGEEVFVPVVALNLNRELAAIQGIVEIGDPAVAQLQGAEGGLIGDFSTFVINSANGRFSFFNTGNQSLALSGRDTLFFLRVLLQGEDGDTSSVNLVDDTGFPLEISDPEFNLIEPEVGPGKVTVRDVFTIAGAIRTHWGDPMPGVSVGLDMTGAGGLSQTEQGQTQDDGRYAFEEVQAGMSGVVAPTKNTNITNGLAAIGIFAAQRFILGFEIPQISSPFQIVAGDANCSGSLTTLDLFIIQKVQVGIDENFPGDCPSWIFVPESERENFQLSTLYYPDYPYAREASLNNLSEDARVDFFGVKVGDILNRADPAGLQAPPILPRSLERAPLLVDADYRPQKGRLYYRLLLPAGRPVASLQFSLAYPSASLSFLEATGGDGRIHPPVVGKADGRLHLSWFSTSGRAFVAGAATELVTLAFAVHGSLGKAEKLLRLDHSGLQALLHDEQLRGAPIDLQPLEVKADAVQLRQNRPNPFEQRTQISFYLPRPTEAELIIRDALGREVWRKRRQYAAGEQLETVELSLSAGVYYYSLKTKKTRLTKSMIVSK